ncbi:MAG: hypothetical protein K0Q59_4050, partial [Paenibacillus sp.]|nr:hypothetical protein [Paenibacillus sp.]
RIETAGGSVGVPSDNSWKCAKSQAYDPEAPRINGCQAVVEVFDTRLEPQWRQPEFDDSAWIPVKKRNIRLTPFWNLVPRPIPLLAEEQLDSIAIVNRGEGTAFPAPLSKRHKQIIGEENTIQFAETGRFPAEGAKLAPIEEGRFHVLTYDFGRIEPGYLQLELNGPAGTYVDVVYAEELWEGHIYLNEDNNRSFDTFILSGERVSCEIAFGWKASRYVQLRVRNHAGDAVIHRVGLRRRAYPIAEHSTFASNDETLQRIWDISEHTLRICMQDAFVDSPSREQQQWMGDGRYQALMNYCYTGDGRLHRKLLEQIGQSQDWHGMTTSRYPDGHHNYPPIPSFCLQWICSFGEYVDHTGNVELLGQWWPNIVLAIRWFTAFENEDGLLCDVPYWQYIDAGESPLGRSLDINRGGIIAGLNLKYMEALRCATRYADIVRDEEAKAHFAECVDTLKVAIEDQLWSEEAGAYADCLVNGKLSETISEPTNALALLYLHDSGDERTETIRRTVFAEASDGKAVAGSPYSMLMIHSALDKLDMNDRALQLIRKRYTPMIEAGATTTWEYWKLFYKEPAQGRIRYGSACHAWASAPLVFFLETILGVRSTAPGCRQAELKPNLFDLEWAEGQVVTVNGPLSVRAEKAAGGTKLKFSVPAGGEVVCNGESYGQGTYEVMMR